MKKPDNKCPHCGSCEIIKKGKRANKNGALQLYKCKECARRFSRNLLRNKSYSPETIFKVLTMYNSGFTIDEVSDKYLVPRSTISNWQREYRQLFNLMKHSKEIRTFKETGRIIERKKYIHGIVYLYRQNTFKNDRFLKRAEPGLCEYLEKTLKGRIDGNIFENSTARASGIKLDILNSLKVIKKKNNACAFASAALLLASNNRQRHDRVEGLMLSNDTSTIAVEMPVFLKLSSSTVPFLKGIKSDNDYITGHIDILQYRNKKLYILDYKPSADKQKPAGQLFVYACCLSMAAGIPFSRIMLGWFDENVYFEFSAVDAYKAVMRLKG